MCRGTGGDRHVFYDGPVAPVPRSSDQVLQNVAMNIRKAKVATGMAVGESCVIQAHQMQHGGVKIVDGNGTLNSPEPEFVRGAVDGATSHATASQPAGESVMIVVATVEGRFLCDGGSAKLATPEH